ncbi:MAG: hypothetical protein Q7R43_00360 [Candidatus Daviesbacteria bacterium]|nr:hypothetical protein [Candidatus Daviesbacteria bacterium]
MTKYLVVALVVVLLLGAVYFTFFGKLNKMLFNKAEAPTPTSTQTAVEVISKPKIPTPTPTSDPETDLTALEQDLANLDKTNVDLTKDINSL